MMGGLGKGRKKEGEKWGGEKIRMGKEVLEEREEEGEEG